jgi:hypothetical protein
MSKEPMEFKEFKEWIAATPDNYRIMIHIDDQCGLGYVASIRPDPIHPILGINVVFNKGKTRAEVEAEREEDGNNTNS